MEEPDNAFRNSALCVENLPNAGRDGLIAPIQQMVIEYFCNPKSVIDDASTRLLERQFDVSEGWMDEQHVDHDPVLCALPAGIREILAFYSELPPSQRCLIRETLAGLKRGIAQSSVP